MTWLVTVLQYSWPVTEGVIMTLGNSGMKIKKKKWSFLILLFNRCITYINFTLPQTGTENLKQEYLVMNECTLGSAVYSQSHAFQNLKWHPRSADHASHWMDKIFYEAVFTRDKNMFYSIRPLELDVKPHFVGFYKWISKHHWSIDTCLVFYFHGHQQCYQFVLCFWTD